MKKPFFIIGMIIALIIIAVHVYFLVLVLSTHHKIIENGHRYEPTAAASHDNKYILQTERTEDESGVYAHFYVRLSTTSEILYECPDKYRTFDLKDIYWADNSYALIVESGDVGTIIYDHEGDNWKQRNFTNADLSISKYSEETGKYYEETVNGYKAAFYDIDEIEAEDIELWLSSCDTAENYYQYICSDPDSWDMFIYYAPAGKSFSNDNFKFSVKDSTVKIYVENMAAYADAVNKYVLIRVQAPLAGAWPNKSELYINDEKIERLE